MPKLLKNPEKDKILDYLKDRFGLARDIFNDYWIVASSRQAFLFRKQNEDFKWPKDNFIRAGLPFIKIVAGYFKPTTVFIQRFGNLANRNTLTLNTQTIKTLCNQGEIAIELNTSPGYIIIKTGEHPIGVALFLEDKRLICKFPKVLRRVFLE